MVFRGPRLRVALLALALVASACGGQATTEVGSGPVDAPTETAAPRQLAAPSAEDVAVVTTRPAPPDAEPVEDVDLAPTEPAAAEPTTSEAESATSTIAPTTTAAPTSTTTTAAPTTTSTTTTAAPATTTTAAPTTTTVATAPDQVLWFWAPW